MQYTVVCALLRRDGYKRIVDVNSEIVHVCADNMQEAEIEVANRYGDLFSGDLRFLAVFEGWCTDLKSCRDGSV